MKPRASPDPWRNDCASDSRSEGCVFDSRRVQYPDPYLDFLFFSSPWKHFLFFPLLHLIGKLSSCGHHQEQREARALVDPSDRDRACAHDPNPARETMHGHVAFRLYSPALSGQSNLPSSCLPPRIGCFCFKLHTDRAQLDRRWTGRERRPPPSWRRSN